MANRDDAPGGSGEQGARHCGSGHLCPVKPNEQGACSCNCRPCRKADRMDEAQAAFDAQYRQRQSVFVEGDGCRLSMYVNRVGSVRVQIEDQLWSYSFTLEGKAAKHFAAELVRVVGAPGTRGPEPEWWRMQVSRLLNADGSLGCYNPRVLAEVRRELSAQLDADDADAVPDMDLPEPTQGPGRDGGDLWERCFVAAFDAFITPSPGEDTIAQPDVAARSARMYADAAVAAAADHLRGEGGGDRG